MCADAWQYNCAHPIGRVFHLRLDMAGVLKSLSQSNDARALLEALGGNCHSPIAALAQVEGSQIRLKAEVFTADGAEMHAGEIVYDTSSNGPALLADQLLAKASDELRSMFAS